MSHFAFHGFSYYFDFMISRFNSLNTNLPKLTIWLIPLRFILLFAEVFIVLAYKGLNHSSIKLLAIPVGITLISNLMIAKRVKNTNTNSLELGLIFSVDILLLWFVLDSAGGASNPFSIFFFLYLVLASILFSRVYAWAIGVFTMLAFGALLTYSKIPYNMHGSHGFDDHLFGMWIAYVAIGIITLSSITFLSREIAVLLQINEKHKQDKLRLQSLTSLATGAAHELGTPLNTIQLLLENLPSDFHEKGALSDELIKCRNILSNLRSQAGSVQGEHPQAMSLKEFVETLSKTIPKNEELISLELPVEDTKFTSLPNTLSQALRNLIKNGIEASNLPVKLKAFREFDKLVFEIEDQGPGISKEIKSRIGEPFISTKGAGLGMGLGIFISRITAEALRGKLDFIDKAEGGTLVRMEISGEFKP